MNHPLSICFAASEVAPFAKTGGLADVAAALPAELHRQGHDVRVFMPGHGIVQAADRHTVDFARDVGMQVGDRHYTFSLSTAKLPGTDLWIYLVDCPELFHRESIYTSDPDEAHRFTMFSRAVIECCQRMAFSPQIFHCNDWHTALIPLLLRNAYDWDSLFRRSSTVMTIHNIGYQGTFPADLVHRLGLGGFAHLFDQRDIHAGKVNFLRTGLLYSDVVTTVSPTYAREIQTPELGMGLDEVLRARKSTLIGILNGVDYSEWSPETDAFAPHHFSIKTLDDKAKNKEHVLEQLRMPTDTAPPLLGMVTRLTAQKGIDIALDVLPDALAGTSLRCAILGSGDARYERAFERLQRQFPGKLVFYRGYSNELAHLIEAGADMFLMPSQYEPCGLNQMFSLRYGTIPIVRRTGGLADSVRQFDPDSGNGTGFLFENYDAQGLTWALGMALRAYAKPRLWRRLQQNAMAEDFSWSKQAKRYLDVYRWLIERS